MTTHNERLYGSKRTWRKVAANLDAPRAMKFKVTALEHHSITLVVEALSEDEALRIAQAQLDAAPRGPDVVMAEAIEAEPCAS